MRCEQFDTRQEGAALQGQAGPHLRYVTAARYSVEWRSRLHTHPCAEVFFVTAGRGWLCLADGRVPIAAHDAILVDPDTPHTEQSTPEHPLEYLVLGVDGLCAAGRSEGYAVVHTGAAAPALRFCLDTIRQETQAKRPGYDTVCQDLLEVALVLLGRCTGVGPAAPSRRASHECALVHRYIDEHYREPLTLERLAAVAHVSRFYLSHAFAREYGVSPISYVLECRIRESLHLLAETHLTLAEISETLGFSSQSYFSQSFKRSQGIPPLAYRATCRGSRSDLPPDGKMLP